MNPTEFPQQTRVLHKPDDMTDEECNSLAIHDGGNEMISCWVPTPEERQQIAAGAPIWLTVLGWRHPPVRLEVATPFEPPCICPEFRLVSNEVVGSHHGGKCPRYRPPKLEVTVNNLPPRDPNTSYKKE